VGQLPPSLVELGGVVQAGEEKFDCSNPLTCSEALPWEYRED